MVTPPPKTSGTRPRPANSSPPPPPPSAAITVPPPPLPEAPSAPTGLPSPPSQPAAPAPFAYQAGVAPPQYPYPYPYSYPPGYAYPPPGYYPYPIIVIQAPKEESKKGVRNIATTMLLYIIASGMAFAIALILFGILLPAITSGGPGNFGSLLGALLLVALIAIIYVVLIIAVIILGLMGFFRIRGGMDEFGPTHRSSVESGTIFIVLGIVTSIAGSVAATFWSLSGGGSATLALVIAPGVGVLSATLFGFGVMRLVEQLADSNERKNLWNFFYITLAGTITGAVITFVWVVTQSASVQQGNLSGFSSLGFTGVGSVVVLIGYYFGWMAYSSIARKMESGALRPGMPLPAGAVVGTGATAHSAAPPPMPPAPSSRPK